MQLHRLGRAFMSALQLSVGIVIYIFVLPIFTIWRILLCLLLPTPIYTPALIHYHHTWNSLKSFSLMKPLVRYWTRIVALSLLLLQAVFALSVLLKSSLLFIPWLMSHVQNKPPPQTQSHSAWLNNLLLHTTAFLATCAPFFSLVGTALGVLYYARKVWVYGRFQKRMIRNPGGRGYYLPEKKNKSKNKKGEEGHRNGGKAVMDSVANALQHFVHPHAVQVPCEEEGSPYGYPGCREDIILQQPARVQKPEPVARFDSNPYTWHGVMSIWSSNKSGYHGRDVRKTNFEDEMEMEDRSSRENV